MASSPSPARGRGGWGGGSPFILPQVAGRGLPMSGSTILVVDDERNIVQLARLYLRNEGYQVETAANGREALDKVRQTSPSLILLDLMMPVMDGWEVCK